MPLCPATTRRPTRTQSQHPTLKDQQVRDYMGNFGLGGPEAVRPLATLSGGQNLQNVQPEYIAAWRSLAMFCRPHILLLDEPTNHLDVSTIAALTKALYAWAGGMVASSHDARFLDEVCGPPPEGGEGEASRGPSSHESCTWWAAAACSAWRARRSTGPRCCSACASSGPKRLRLLQRASEALGPWRLHAEAAGE
jgi:hypothetical protein